MKKFIKDFLLRGLIAAAGGPLVLAIIYGILGATGAVTQLTPSEVCKGILSVILLAFVVGGMNAIYQQEKLPLASAILIHGSSLYITYVLIYLLNDWIKKQLAPILVFSGIFIVGYALIWLVIYMVNKSKIQKINSMLHKDQ